MSGRDAACFAKKPKIEALQGVNFSVNAGESFGIVGESGSGKSTLAKAILALEEPTAGTIRFMGQNLVRPAGPAAARDAPSCPDGIPGPLRLA